MGLAKPGRGKLSFAAHAAIKKAIADGVQIDDYKEGKVVRNETSGNSTRIAGSNDRSVGSQVGEAEAKEYPPIPENPVTHDYDTIYGIDTRGRSPIVIGFGHCSKCSKQVVFCSHDVPYLPEWIGGGEGLVNPPTEEQKCQAMSMTKMEDTENTKPFWAMS